MEAEAHFKDRIGEDTDPSDCALCHAVSCFAYVQGYCTALEKYVDGGCVFYRSAEENRREIRRCFYRLISCERFDLLYKYADTMAALGLMDQETVDARNQRLMLAEYRRIHLDRLRTECWKDSLIVISPSDEEDDEQAETAADAETQESDTESEFDNDIDCAVFPVGITDAGIDDETADEINTRNHIIREEIKDKNFRPADIADGIREQQEPAEKSEVNLPSNYPEDFDEIGTQTYEEWVEAAEEKELAEEAEQEKAAGNAEYERNQAENGDSEYVTVPVNYLYRRIGFPVRQKRPPDPVVLAYENLGAGIVYAVAEEYIETLRLLWGEKSGEYNLPRLIVRKWELETYMGSQSYWLYTNINPERILDQCARTAMNREIAKAERINRRMAAGIEGGDGA